MPAFLKSLADRFVRRTRMENEMDEELRAHMELRAEDLERSGLARGEAERQARLEFGGVGRFKEECEEELSGRWLESAWMDTRYSLRVLRKSPGFAAAAILTLAIAIGANAVVFGLLDGLVLRPLNVPQAENLWGTAYGQNAMWESYQNYLDLRARNHSFEDLAAFKFMFVGLDAGNQPSLATGFRNDGKLFRCHAGATIPRPFFWCFR